MEDKNVVSVPLGFICLPAVKLPILLEGEHSNGDHNRYPNIKALERRGFINHGLHKGFKAERLQSPGVCLGFRV